MLPPSSNVLWFYLIILSVGSSIGFAPCRTGYVRQELGWYSTVCCRWTECRAGYYVKTCTEDFGEDRCRPCPPGTFLLDNTTSDFAVQCFDIPSCPEDAKPVNYFSPMGCRIPCICDTSKNRYGRDPCRCYTKECPAGKFLTLDGACTNTSQVEEPPAGAVFITR